MDAPQLLFVYGTLKRGLPNHVSLPSDLTFHAAARTQEALPLVVGPHGIPFLLSLPGKPRAFQVVGELYTVPPTSWSVVDAFEGTASRFYQRIEVAVEVEKGGTCTAWVYVRHPENGGPEWMQGWSVERLAQEEYIENYTPEVAKSFVPRGERGT